MNESVWLFSPTWIGFIGYNQWGSVLSSDIKQLIRVWCSAHQCGICGLTSPHGRSLYRSGWCCYTCVCLAFCQTCGDVPVMGDIQEFRYLVMFGQCYRHQRLGEVDPDTADNKYRCRNRKRGLCKRRLNFRDDTEITTWLRTRLCLECQPQPTTTTTHSWTATDIDNVNVFT